ncbi:MAG TPA: MFS transporter [Thermomicrobiaceae bacterium]|nr:MFS transporter [Thermomicrobiaceae bacterium]
MLEAEETAPTTQAAARRLPLLALLGANAVSQIGNQLTALAIPWYVLRVTGSPALVGLTGFVQGCAYIAAAFLGGVVVDRLGLRRASVLTDLASGVAIALIPLLHQTIGLRLWQLLIVIFAASLLNTPGLAARRGMLADLAALGAVRLERATSAEHGIGNFASLVGPILAGVLLAIVAPASVLWLDAVSFALSAALIGSLVPARWPPLRGASYRQQFAEGLSFIRHNVVVRTIALLGSFINAVGAGLFGVVFPVYAARVFGSALGLGAMAAADGGGALAGTVVYGAIGHRLPKRPTLLAAFTLSALGLSLLALTPPLLVTVAVLVVDGFMFGIIGPLTYTIYRERVPEALGGRAFAAILGIHRLAVPFGALLAGSLLGVLSIPVTVAAIAALSLVVPLGVLLRPSLRDL